MVAPGSNGSSYISRDNFESDPKGYFDNLHGSGQAPGSNGSSTISRDKFESDTKGYFDNLHGKK
ncbi:unnamed protein product [Arabidopsis thaliana]|uniref:(thale cress) hypothetical protein n=1 Tax=Arabidopsis thaliana TaxID=3702 RepID=A0A7G2ED73_ARATH|nr:unnamed protein product [Arabidopsis thaliana]